MEDQEDVIHLEFELDQAKERIAKLEELVEGMIAGFSYYRVMVPELGNWVETRQHERELRALAEARTSPSRRA